MSEFSDNLPRCVLVLGTKNAAQNLKPRAA